MLLTETVPCGYSDDKYKVKMSELKAKLALKDDADDYEILDLVYKPNDTKSLYVRVKHLTCGNEFHVTTSKFFNNVSAKCPECTLKSNRITIDDVRKIVEEDTNGEYTLLSESIKNAKDSITVRHNTCGKEYPITIRRFREGSRCSCTREVNKPKSASVAKAVSLDDIDFDTIKQNAKQNKRELLKYIRSIYSGEVLTNHIIENTNVKVTYYVPEFNVAIQFNDLILQSEEGSSGTYNRKHRITELHELDNNGIRVINIMSDEWNNKKDIVKSKVEHILGCSNKKRIYARKCKVKEIDSKTRCTFLESNHIQGKDVANVSLGLYYTDENNKEILVSVMSYIKPRKALNGNSKYDYELSRFASLKEYNVVGAFGKLMSYFKKNYEWNLIVTYADLRYTSLHKSVYLTNGFTHLHNSDPSYSYVDMKNLTPSREFRFKYRKQELPKFFPNIYDKDKTEKQIMQEAGYARVWDCGNLVFEMKK